MVATRPSGETKLAVYLDFGRAIKEQGVDAIRGKYGNLFDMYDKITDEDPYKNPMRIYPAVHYTMGGLWVDYHLESTVPGLFVLGEDAASAKLVGVIIDESRSKWMDRGKEGNKLGYYRVTKSKIRWADKAGKEHDLELTSLISWRGEWFVVHLHGFK